jgi:hypothetical protein
MWCLSGWAAQRRACEDSTACRWPARTSTARACSSSCACPEGRRAPASGTFALGIADAEALHHRLREAGVPLRSEPVTIDDTGDWQGPRCFYAEDPDGTVVELIERTSARS